MKKSGKIDPSSFTAKCKTGISIAFSKLSDPDDNSHQSSFILPINLREIHSRIKNN
ncbi:hypothetical protein ACIQYG_06580 [Peribacillus sp. NPDC096622]|uniref:hypothetical protein n=1 Tax=Peribacillus sp. NPDC096622 TaxID=3364396 RepID=UPI003811D9CC